MHPLNPVCETKFMFDINGEIIGLGSDAEVTINLLNLKKIKTANFLPAIVFTIIFVLVSNIKFFY